MIFGEVVTYSRISKVNFMVKTLSVVLVFIQNQKISIINMNIFIESQ
jgi:hypothetical protein